MDWRHPGLATAAVGCQSRLRTIEPLRRRKFLRVAAACRHDCLRASESQLQKVNFAVVEIVRPAFCPASAATFHLRSSPPGTFYFAPPRCTSGPRPFG